MPKLTLDEIEYNTEDLSERGQVTLQSLQFLEIQLKKLKNEVAVYQTAQRTYLAALKEEISRAGVKPLQEKEKDAK